MPTPALVRIQGSALARVAYYALWLVLFCSATLTAQTVPAVDSSPAGSTRVTFGAMALGVLTRADPAYAGRTFTEFQLVQPLASVAITGRHLSFVGMLNGEGYTLRRGELNAGIFGEGYVDRRHPHTLVHEAMLTWMPRAADESRSGARLSFSLSAGRGFVPFGSDDPMMRPLEKYPVNHHHAQILERIQAIAATRIAVGEQSVSIELTSFNGDEPAGPFHGPRWNRFGDSWAVRGTVQPVRRVEFSVSEASIVSPELQQGGAFDHRQRHVSVRFDDASGTDSRYAMAEWARTDERTDRRTAFRYQSFLVEGAYGWRRAKAAARIERTDRAEQNRLADPLRVPSGHVDFQILGVTQWTVATVGVQAPSLVRFPFLPHFAPFIELSRATPVPRQRPTVFEPSAFYGDDQLWSVSVGVRLHAGTMRRRMGRYGVMSSFDETRTRHHGM